MTARVADGRAALQALRETRDDRVVPDEAEARPGNKLDRSYVGLDLIRFAAAIAVASYHLCYWWWLPGVSGRLTHPIFVEPVRWGWVGLPVFFVLSGFVIAFSTDGRPVSKFVAGRVTRLYPAAWICASITLVTTRMGSIGALGDYARSLALSPVGPWVSGVYWSLGVEIVFYALVALSLAMRWRLTSIAMALGLTSSGYWFLRAADFATGGHCKAVFGLFEGPVGGLTLLPYGCDFAIGIALWAMNRGLEVRKMRILTFLCLCGGLVSLAAVARFHLASEGGSALHMVEAPFFWFVAVLAIAASVRCNGALRARLAKFAAPIRTVGVMTYPLYLLHSEVGHAMMLTLPLGLVASLGLTFLAIISMSFAVVALERYPQAALKALLGMGRRRDVPAADLP